MNNIQTSTPGQIAESEVRKILNDLIETIENNPNNMELGDTLRKKYWKELKEIKNNL